MRRTGAADPTLGGSYRNLQVLHAVPDIHMLQLPHHCGQTYRRRCLQHLEIASFPQTGF